MKTIEDVLKWIAEEFVPKSDGYDIKFGKGQITLKRVGEWSTGISGTELKQIADYLDDAPFSFTVWAGIDHSISINIQ